VDPFPEPWELIGLFECEPKLADADMPWFYNRVRFDRRRGNERIELVIEPADHDLAFRWSIDGEAIIDLDLHDVVGLEVRLGHGKESLIVSTGDPHQRPIDIEISPKVRLIVGDEPR
jgi:hypothetical protein